VLRGRTVVNPDGLLTVDSYAQIVHTGEMTFPSIACWCFCWRCMAGTSERTAGEPNAMPLRTVLTQILSAVIAKCSEAVLMDCRPESAASDRNTIE
jgi:hypothetical protein